MRKRKIIELLLEFNLEPKEEGTNSELVNIWQSMIKADQEMIKDKVIKDMLLEFALECRKEGINLVLSKLEANLALCNWGDKISARKLWNNIAVDYTKYGWKTKK